MSAASPGPAGLRERKRQRVREALAEAALGLFLDRGFEATTVDAVAAAAGVSPRTFFRYFASKEEVVFVLQDGMSAEIAAVATARPASEPPLAALRHAVLALLGPYDRDDAAALCRLVMKTPALRARNHEKYGVMEETLVPVVAERLGPDPTLGLRPRLIVMAAVGALRVGLDAWVADGCRRSPAGFVEETFALLRVVDAPP